MPNRTSKEIMTERECFLRKILEEPAEDCHRLVYADWLDENGDHDDRRAAGFVRWHCANTDISAFPPDECGSWSHYLPVTHDGWGMCGDARKVSEQMDMPTNGDVLSFGFDRGFVSAVWCGAERFLANAEGWFRACPITRVTLTDREPGENHTDQAAWWPTRPGDDVPLVRTTEYLWRFRRHRWGLGPVPTAVGPSAWDVPPALWPYFDPRHPARVTRATARYDTREAAVSALSAACVAYGRAIVKLPPLPEPSGVRA